MIYQKILIWIFWILAGFTAASVSFAQAPVWVKGDVRDTLSSKPISGATVIIQQNRQIVGYGLTNDLGRFEIKLVLSEGISAEVSCRHISYLPKVERIDPKHLQREIHFFLTASSKTLEAVLLHSKTPESKDTTEFLVRGITDVQTKKVEDLLKKLPGFEVAKNGQLRYNNREVQTVLLNGDNLAGANYGVITRNLDANTLDRVQVIDNFSENRVIGEVFKTGDIAVNLVTKEELEGKLNGSVDAGTSFFKRYNAGIDLVAIKNRKQGILFSNFNNEGDNKYPSFTVGTKSNLITRTSSEVAYFNPTPVNSLKNLNLPGNYLPNDTRKNVFPSLSIPISKTVKLFWRTNVEANSSMASQTQSTQTRISEFDFYKVNDFAGSQHKANDLNSVVSLKIDSRKRTAFDLGLGIQHRVTKNEYQQLQSGDYSDTLYSDSKIHFTKYSLTASGAYRLSYKQVLGFSLNSYFIKEDGAIRFSTDRFLGFYQQPAYNKFLQQQVGQENKVILGDIFYLRRLKRGSNTFKLSFIHYDNRLHRNIEMDSSTQFMKPKMVSMGINRLAFNKNTVQFIHKNRNDAGQDLELYASSGFYNLMQPVSRTYLHYKIYGNLSGRLNARIHFGADLGSYNFLPAPEMILKDSLIEGVSVMRLISHQYKPVSMHLASLTLTRTGWVDYRVSYQVKWRPRSLEPEIIYNPQLSIYYYKLFSGGWNNAIKGNIKVYSLKLRGTFYLNAGFENKFNKGESNSLLVNRVINSINTSIKYVSNYKTIWNFEVSYMNNLNFFRQTGAELLKTKNRDVLLYLSQRLDISKSFFIGAAYNYYKYSFGHFNQADIFSSWQISPSLRVDLKFINVFAQKNYRMQFNDVNNEFKMETAVAKPYAMLMVNWQF